MVKNVQIGIQQLPLWKHPTTHTLFSNPAIIHKVILTVEQSNGGHNWTQAWKGEVWLWTGKGYTYTAKIGLQAWDDSRFAPNQWETSLQSNAVSHWLGANLESALDSNVFAGPGVEKFHFVYVWFSALLARIQNTGPQETGVNNSVWLTAMVWTKRATAKFQYLDHLSRYGDPHDKDKRIPVIKMRWSHDHLIFIMRIHTWKDCLHHRDYIGPVLV